MVEYRLELIQVPVSDVERSKEFYTDQAGFHLDVDYTVHEGLRFIQLTPPGSPASIAIGLGMTTMQPGCVEGLQLVVTDIEAAREELLGRGIDVTEVKVFDWGSFIHFADPDGNKWSVQQMPKRSP